MVRTPPFHGGDTGSSPVEDAKTTKLKTIGITPALLERAGRAKKRFPCSARISHGALRLDVAFRPWHDGYNVYNKDGQWLASFDDVSLRGKPALENISCRQGIAVQLKGFEPSNS